MSTIDLYAVLGVARDASADEIRTAWKSAVADLDPTAPTFRAFNQAGAVLLDPVKREQYDAELAESEAESEADAEAGDDVAGLVPDAPAPAAPATTAAPVTAPREPAAAWSPSSFLLTALAVLTVAAVLAAVFAAGPLGRALPDRGVPTSEQRLIDATAAAEKLAPVVLSYDYRHMDADEKEATSHMTPAFAEKFRDLFALLKQGAGEAQSVVTAKVVASAVARSGGDSVDVLLFVDRPTAKKGQAKPVVYHDYVTFKMVREGGDWLVAALQAAQPA